ncbi:hypothetical protein P8452_36185 [Trifolium repens]|nr:hypothetical protein P8452_36185 [Trifolium repens]
MAQRAYSFFAFLLIFNIVLVTKWQAVAGRSIANDDKKEPEFLFKHDHGKKFHYPGIGHFGFPPNFGLTPNNPHAGGIGGGSGSGAGSGSGSTGHSYVPGGDDTFVPNPGFEVPIPGGGSRGGGGKVASTVHP